MRFVPIRLLAYIFALLISTSAMVCAGDDGPSAYYHAIGKNFTINLRPSNAASASGFLQTRVEVMVRSQHDLETVQRHTPFLRNDLIMLFSSKTREQLLKTGGQKALRRQALSVIRKRIKKEDKKTQIVKVLFTQVIIE